VDADFEKLGVFYLGRMFDLARGEAGPDLLLYDSKDLVTHAVCVGMTGSGKTGLCLGLIEEAAIDGIPAILIDPKGDLANLMLTFPDLAPSDFEPWVNDDEAAAEGISRDELAAKQAETWRNGLAEWGQDGERIHRLKDAAEVAIYTPGSQAGLPVSILKSFGAPPPAVIADPEALADRIGATASALLTLAGIDADPIRSREHILVSTIVGDAWKNGRSLELADLIQLIQSPPVSRIGVMDIDTFFPSKDRFELALAINNLLASPAFEAWMEGDLLDIGSMLRTPEGKPRISIFSIAHLNDAERMFFVSLLLSEMLAWTRSQSGTTSLRAMLYMDEIFGYFPPIANPPSKAPLLTLLKQARAFGVGVVLATQNPVDLDYKGLGNTGTWLIGRLQTARDKERVLEGLEGAAAGAGSGFDRSRMDEILAGLGKRVFLMNNIHEDSPVVFQSRWTLSYLAGPLTQSQIKTLMEPVKAGGAGRAHTPAPSGAAAGAASPGPPPAASAGFPTSVPGQAASRPVLGPGIRQYFLPVRGDGDGATLSYRPMLFGAAEIRFADARSGVDTSMSLNLLTPVLDRPVPVDWDEATQIELGASDLETEPEQGGVFGELASPATKATSYQGWQSDLVKWLYGSQSIELRRSPSLKAFSTPGETEVDFRLRLQQAGRERRDAGVEELRDRYAAKTATLQERLRRAQAATEREAEQAKQAKLQTAISIGGTVLGAFLGRKGKMVGLGRATTAVRGAARAAQQAGDVRRAEDTVEAVQQQLTDLEAQFKADAGALTAAGDPMTEQLESVTLRPKKTDISISLVALVWAPAFEAAGGEPKPAW
jgi:hypothetical protein